MIRIEFDVDVERPVEDVFAYLTDPRRLHEWQPRTTSVEVEGDEPVGVGTRFRETRQILGRDIEQTVEVSEYEPPRRFGLRIVDGPLKVDGAHELEPRGSGTRIHVVAAGEPTGAARLGGPLVKRALERELRGHYGRLKRNLEAGEAAGS